MSLAAAVRALGAARPLVLLLDIDGTLAPIAPRPEAARVPADTLDLLGALAGRAATHLVFVTGRTPDSARAIAPVAGAWVVGNHGAEQAGPDGRHAVDPRVAAYADAMRGAAAELGAFAAGVPGVRLEDKRWSLSLHYRQAARDAVPAVLDAARAAAARAGLRAGDGKEVVEVRAPVDVDKGTAAVALADALGARGGDAGTLAAGDDVTDEDLFRHARSALPRAVTVRVGAPGVPTAAEHRVDGPSALAALLASLLTSRPGAPGAGSR